MEAKTKTKFHYIFLFIGLISSLVSFYLEDYGILHFVAICILLFICGVIFLNDSRSNLIITENEIKVKFAGKEKVFLIDDFVEFRIIDQTDYRVLTGFKKANDKLTSVDIAYERYNVPLEKILEFIHDRKQGINIGKSDIQIKINDSQVTSQIDDLTNEKYENQCLVPTFIYSIYCCLTSVVLYLNHTFSLVLFVVSVIFTVIWYVAIHYLVRVKKMFKERKSLITVILPLVYATFVICVLIFGI